MRHMNTVHKDVENLEELRNEVPARKSLIVTDQQVENQNFQESPGFEELLRPQLSNPQ